MIIPKDFLEDAAACGTAHFEQPCHFHEKKVLKADNVSALETQPNDSKIFKLTLSKSSLVRQKVVLEVFTCFWQGEKPMQCLEQLFSIYNARRVVGS